MRSGFSHKLIVIPRELISSWGNNGKISKHQAARHCNLLTTHQILKSAVEEKKLLRILLLNTFKIELVGFFAANRPRYVVDVHFDKRLQVREMRRC